ncbi:MAG: dehydrogenase, partial [Planctomycetes bacterium]|nr:dehydrogenase [Planctomycetota bacterium]
GTQHDHGIHAFHFGPDGKLYFNFGNLGKQIKDKDGNPIIDLSGETVDDSKSQYQEGMLFRCEMDGSRLESLGWNFRNNWEMAVDSFGTIWQSDNDDDGNKGVRINFVMEFGNYGYKDEWTRAGWRTERTNMEAEIPLQHWHLNDPGVVPNLIQTGAGSPTGIVVYEGSLLPEIFRNQIIHCDAGPSVVRSYPVKSAGAGYSAEIVNILNGTRDNWFRPSDVCVAPDGSLFVADWYDPGVGGHRMGDADRGRLFRLAPPKTRYDIPKVDVSTVSGALEALKSPNEVTRYLAWTALHSMGDSATEVLKKSFETETNPRFRARVLWLLAMQSNAQDSATPKLIETINSTRALSDKDPDIRITALRAIRRVADQAKTPAERFTPILFSTEVLSRDENPAVRRECAIALRQIPSEIPGFPTDNTPVQVQRTGKPLSKHALWAILAMQYDPRDRWSLEALGIGAGKDWDACLSEYLGLPLPVALTRDDHAPKRFNRTKNQSNDIVWRSRSKSTASLLAKILSDPFTSAQTIPRYLRAFDFLKGPEKDATLVELAFGDFGNSEKTLFINT